MTGDTKVIAFPKQPSLRGWVCGCGGQAWTLFENGDCVCNGCGFISTVIRVTRATDSAGANDADRK